MTTLTVADSKGEWLRGVWLLTRRELRDTLRDWRMVTPIVLLTLVFPVIMTFTAGAAQGFVSRFGTPLIAERLIPFLLMIVGFFPISFSLVIALEAFVGERERKSLEPLLATPLSNGQSVYGQDAGFDDPRADGRLSRCERVLIGLADLPRLDAATDSAGASIGFDDDGRPGDGVGGGSGLQPRHQRASR